MLFNPAQSSPGGAVLPSQEIPNGIIGVSRLYWKMPQLYSSSGSVNDAFCSQDKGLLDHTDCWMKC